MSRIEKKRVLGHGSQATVYEGYDSSLDRKVAVKEISADRWADEEWREAFLLEARKMAAVSHPHVLTIHSVDQEGDGPALILEYADRGTLRDLLAAGPVQPAQVHRILRQALSGLAEIHRHNILHRDLKPENILLVRDTYKIGDFGVAGQGVGSRAADLDQTIPMSSPRYVAPEALTTAPGPRSASDVYSLGLVAYELLVGSRNFEEAARETAEAESGEAPGSGFALWMQFQRSRLDLPPPTELDPTIPESLSRVVERMIRKDPDQRYGSPDEVLRDLSPSSPVGDPWPKDDHVPTASHPIVKPPGMPRVLKWAALVLMVLVGILGALWLMARKPADPIMVTSEPPGAQVVHEGEVLGETPVRLNAPIGTELVVRKGGFLDLTLAYTEPGEKELYGKLLPAVLTVDSDPPGAQVALGGETLGSTPLELDWGALPAELTAEGRIPATLSLAGYLPVELELTAGSDLRQELRRSPFRHQAVTDPEALAGELGRFAGPGDAASIRLRGGPEEGPARISLGAPLRFSARTSEPAHLTLFVLSSDGSIACIYPSAQRPRLQVDPGETLLPLQEDHDAGFEILAGRPVGRDMVFLLATAEPMGPLPASGDPGQWISSYSFQGEWGGAAREFAHWVAEAVLRSPTENHLARLPLDIVESRGEGGS